MGLFAVLVSLLSAFLTWIDVNIIRGRDRATLGETGDNQSGVHG